MQKTTRTRISYVLLGLMVVLFATAQYFEFHDIYAIPFVLAAIGTALMSCNWKGWVVACAFLGVALFWSRADQHGCSAWWRARYVIDKSVGNLPYVSWDDVWSAALDGGHCFYPEGKHEWVADSVQLMDEETVNGHVLQLYKTNMGNFWIPEEHGQGSIVWLVWEIGVYETYQGHTVTILPGDTVIDAGAHIGVYTRYALNRGAGRVVAIEPNPDNILCLERNFAEEIAEGKVVVVKAGIWNEKSELELHLHQNISSRPTFFHIDGISHSITVPVKPLDNIVEELNLEKVDFIKMDIEGAERQALEGARRTIERFHPRMAICTYHMEDDPEAVPEVALSLEPDYNIHAKELDVNWKDTRPKVLFFN